MPNECYIPQLERIQTQDKWDHQASSGEAINKATYVQLKMQSEQKGSFENYDDYLKFETAREIARINLPLSTYTQWYWKMDLHNLFHFLRLRLDSHAQYEIRVYAEAIFGLVKPIVPVSCEAFEDYVLYAKKFSRQEIEVLKQLLSPHLSVKEAAKDSGFGKLEMKELIQKLK